ncbi:hypothetical protein ACIGHN_13455 [Acidovorax sp. NPDC077693]|uniref:hypothetical protein n=1 Tax=unclassified Acidovorax TaxID=2684926 RepID=UPI0037CAA054
MRPAGEIRKALLDACAALASGVQDPDHGPTLREIAHRACVGLDAAQDTMKNMVRAKVVHTVNTRKVPYRNRPVAEYRPGALALAANDPIAALAGAVRAWG